MYGCKSPSEFDSHRFRVKNNKHRIFDSIQIGKPNIKIPCGGLPFEDWESVPEEQLKAAKDVHDFSLFGVDRDEFMSIRDVIHDVNLCKVMENMTYVPSALPAETTVWVWWPDNGWSGYQFMKRSRTKERRMD